MYKYIFRRILYLIPVILGVTFIVFMILNLAPGDSVRMILGEQATPEQVAALEKKMGIDKPLLVQYLNYMKNLLRGNLELSYRTNQPVAAEVFSSFIPDIITCCYCFSVLLAIPIGVIAATKQNTAMDTATMIVALIDVSMPMFWLSLLLILLFSLKWDGFRFQVQRLLAV